MELTDKKWDYFQVGSLFNIYPTATYKDFNSNNFNNAGTTPVVVNTAINNGIGGMTTLAPLEDAGIITYSDTTDGNTFFYQDKPFVGFAHVQGMHPINFSLNLRLKIKVNMTTIVNLDETVL